MDESELESALSGNGPEAHDPASTSRLQALNGRDVDYDLGDMTRHPTRYERLRRRLDVGQHTQALDMDIGTATVPDTRLPPHRSCRPMTLRCPISSPSR